MGLRSGNVIARANIPHRWASQLAVVGCAHMWVANRGAGGLRGKRSRETQTGGCCRTVALACSLAAAAFE